MTIHKQAKNIKSLNPIQMPPSHKTIHDIAVEVQVIEDFIKYLIKDCGYSYLPLRIHQKEFTSKRIQYELEKEPSNGN